MADLGRALAEYGVAVTRFGRTSVDLDGSELARKTERLGSALRELRAAWEDMPPGIRRDLACTIHLNDQEPPVADDTDIDTDPQLHPLEEQIHHDGHGLNDQHFIVCDDEDHEAGGGASHLYCIVEIGDEKDAEIEGCVCYETSCHATIQFQHGPRHLESSTPGCTDAGILAVIIDRYEKFQRGPFACPENAEVLEHLGKALAVMRRRADERAARGVLGKLEA